MYRSINAEFWTDPKVSQLAPLQRYLFLYCITNPQSHLSGIYPIRLSLIQEETGLSGRVFEGAFETLSKAQVITYDDVRKVLWVVNMLEYQARGPKVWSGAANQLKRLHHSPLIPLFLKRYPQVLGYLEKIGYQYPTDTISENYYPISISNAVSSPDPEKRIQSEKKCNGRATTFPENWKLEPELKQYAEALKLDAFAEFGHFRDHHLAKGTVFKNWPAAYRTWLRISVKFKQKGR